MIYSTALKRSIHVRIEYLNRFDEAELEAALVALPGWPDMSADDIRTAAKNGDLNAEYVIARAEAGDPTAKSFLT